MMARDRKHRDKINQASITEVTQGVVALADISQRMPPHIRALAAAGFLTLLMEHLDIPPQDVMTALGNLRTEADAKGMVEFNAIEAYLKEDF